MADVYHLWREQVPLRWACDVVADPKAPEGYRVVDHEPTVADAAYLQVVHDTLTSHVMGKVGGTDHVGTNFDGEQMIEPGGDRYFENAIRAVPRTYLRSSGRSA